MSEEDFIESLLLAKSEREKNIIITKFADYFYESARSKGVTDQEICKFGAEIIGQFTKRLKILNRYSKLKSKNDKK